MSLIRVGFTARSCFSTLTSNGQKRLQKHDEFTQHDQDSKEEENTNRKRADKDEDIQSKILEAALKFVPEHGWSKESIDKGVEEMKLPKISSGIITNGPIDLVHYHYEKSNNLLDSQMKLEVADCLSKETKIRPSVFLRKHVENRLRMNTPYLGHWANALALMAAPQNVPKSMNFGLNLVDSMWFHAGDKSLDYNWYTKRLMLLGVYKSSELAMMQDKSEDFGETWQFLDRRFQDVHDLGGILKGGPEDVGKMINSLGTTFKAIVGMPR